MKNGIKKKIILLMSMLIMFFMAMISFKTTSYGSTQYVNGITWYYDVVDGEAVNVYISSGRPGTTLTVPSTLGGYPVTEVVGPVISSSRYNILGNDSQRSTTQRNLTTIVLPNTIKKIGEYAFGYLYRVTSINLPEGLETIEKEAFYNFGNNTNITIPNSVTNIENEAFAGSNISGISLGTGITTINEEVFHNCRYLENVHVPSSVTTMNYNSFTGMKDVYIDNTQENIEILGNRNGYNTNYPYIHFLGDTKTINTNVLDGIKIIDTSTNEEFTSKSFNIGNNVTIKVENNSNINNLILCIESESDYYGGTNTFQNVVLDQNNTYTIENLTRNKTIYVQEEKQGLDLALRQFISKVNGTNVSSKREPEIRINNGVINYIQSKAPVYVGKNNTIEYTLRVYNEGNIDGTANKIKYFIPEGLKYNYLNIDNMQNRWEVSEDGTYATTEVLKNRTIQAYSGAQRINYEDITINLIMDPNARYDIGRIVTIAEITEASSEDVDSTFGNIDTIVDSSYMEEESLIPNSYIHGEDDDNDFEAVTLSDQIESKYNLRINKIDGLDNALLNGATFELFDENMEVIKTGVTANGGVLDFGLVDAFGPGTKKYYIKEVYTPEGYKNHINYLIEVTIITEVENGSEANSKVELSLEDIDIDTSKYQTIIISSKDEFVAMQSNQNSKYVLTQDIDLDGVEWTPMNLENVILDGNNHKISNLTLEFDESTNKKVGLFETYSGIIENLTLDNVDIKVTKTTEDEITETTEEDIHAAGGLVGYSKGTIFKNCKVTGKVESEVDNVGGFVGHSKVGTLDVYRNCTNEAEISTTEKNAGGLIGTALGPVQVISSINKGNVTAGVYNAGGMIGAAECQGYTTDKVIGEYIDDNKSIQITVKNERIQGKYKLKIEKIDGKDKSVLNGAKFTLYDRTKNPIEGYENVELTEGTLEIPVVVEHIGTDTYYLKETQAPDAYEKISDEYIKIEITKKWNNQTEEYVSTGSISMLTEEELERDTPKSNNTSGVATDMTYTKENSDVDWKLNKVSISKNTVNQGNITSNNLNAAGLLGRAQCDVTITNSSNTGTIEAANGNSAGILAEQKIEQNNDKKLYIKNVTNTGAIKQTENPEYLYESCSGIVATINTDAEIYNAVNDGEITAVKAHTAGILSNCASDILIMDGCINNGNISATGDSTTDVGGILARGDRNKKFDGSDTNSLNKKSEHKISNCTNTGDLTGPINIGSILGESRTKKIEIYNCTVEDSNITSDHYAGNGFIAAQLCNDSIIIDSCQVTGGSIVNSDSAGVLGGVIGSVEGSIYSGDNSIIPEITISNCNITGSEILGKGNTAGILGHITNKATKTLITKCKFENGTIKSTGLSYQSIGGILAYLDQSNSISINECVIKNTNIGLELERQGGDNNNVGGIVGTLGGNGRVKKLKTTNCEIEDCDIFNIVNATPQGTTGGIIGYIYSDEAIEIYNSNIKNTHIHSDNGTIGGIISTAFGSQETKISGCDITGLTIDGEQSNNSLVGHAGIISYSNNSANVENCKIKDSTIHSNNSGVAGIVRVINGPFSANNIEIDNMNLISDVPYNSLTNVASGGVVGWADVTADISNAIIKNSLIEANGTSVGGICGGVGSPWDSNSKFKNCEINNTIIKNTLNDTEIGTNSAYNTSIAGIVAVGQNSNIENCKVTNNSQIISKTATTGGIVGYQAQGTIKNCSFENSTIKSDTLINNTAQGQIGAIAAISDCDVENCSVLDTNIIANGEHVGGLVGQTSFNFQNIDTCTVERLNITHNNSVEMSDSISYEYKARGVGGALGTLPLSSVAIKDSTFKNITINVPGTKTTMFVGGLIGLTKGNVTITNEDIEDNIEIENINVSNTAPSSITGGLIGFSTILDEIVLSDMNLKNINVTGTYHTGGMIGSTAKAKINNIVVEGLQVQETETSATAGGLVGRIQKEMGDTSSVVPSIQLNNIEIKPLNNKDNIIKATDGSHAGVLVGLAMKVELNTNANDKIKVSNTRVNSTASTAGLIGQTENINNISNIEIENVRMISDGHAGGVIGQIAINWSNPNTNPITVSNIKAKNVKATSRDVSGGIIGITNSSAQLTVKDIEVENIETKANLKSGAIIGFTATSQAFNMSNITAKHLNGTASQDIGGLIGFTVNSSVFNVENVTAEDLTLTCADAVGQYSQNVGGIVGAATNPKFNNIHITDINMNSQHLHHIGGLVGAATQMNSNSSQGAEFKNIIIDASEGKTNVLQGTTTDYDSYSGQSAYKFGGILVGFVNQKAKIDGTIQISDTTLRDNGGYYRDESGFGGLIGFANEYENPTTLTNSIELSNVNIIGTGRVGGIIGDVYTLSNMHDITLNNVSVNALNGYSSAGLIGMAMKQQKGSGQDITFDVSNINVNGLTVNGNNGVQQIAGLVAFAPNVNVNNVVGENITITGNAPNSIGGLLGVTAMYDDATNEELITQISDINLKGLTISSTTGGSNMGGLVAEAMRPRVKDVILEDINITNNGYGSTGGVVGIVTNTNRTFTNTDLTSEGEFSNITIRKSEGAENPNIIVGSLSNSSGIITSTGKISTNTIGATDIISVSDTNLQSRRGFAGIFGLAEEGSDIKGVIANNVNIQSGTDSSGIIAGQVKGSLSNCQVSNSSITNTLGQSTFTGGIVGLKERAGAFTNCTVTNTTITSSATNGIGGLAGLSKSPTSDCTVTDCTITATANSMWAVGGLLGGITNGDTSDTTVTRCNVINTSVSAKSATAGGLIGVSDFKVSNSKVTDGTITVTASSDATGGLVGRITNSALVDNCEVIDSTISSYSSYIGGLVGFANNNINSSNVVGTTITSQSSNSGTGGIVGHGSNASGNDTSITGCNVMDTTISGQEKVGGIAGGAVSKISNCYVGEKQGSTYEEGINAVTITGTDSVGGIIGDPGIISADNYIMITMQGNSMNNVRINRNSRTREEGEDDIIFAMMGQHNRLDDSYEPEEPRSETISTNTASNCILNINE